MGLEEGLERDMYDLLRRDMAKNVHEKLFKHMYERVERLFIRLLASENYPASDSFVRELEGLIKKYEIGIERGKLPEAIPAPSPEAIPSPSPESIQNSLKQRLFEQVKSGEISKAAGLKGAICTFGVSEQEYFKEIGVKNRRAVGGIKGAARKHYGYPSKK